MFNRPADALNVTELAYMRTTSLR